MCDYYARMANFPISRGKKKRIRNQTQIEAEKAAKA